MDNTKKTSLKHTLLKFSLVPVLVLGLVLTFISTRTLVQVTTEQVSQSLKVAARSVYNTYSLIAPGDMYEKDGMHLEDVLMHVIRVKFIRPSVRKYETENYYESDPEGEDQKTMRKERGKSGGKKKKKDRK